jgi:hypothetical protein
MPSYGGTADRFGLMEIRHAQTVQAVASHIERYGPTNPSEYQGDLVDDANGIFILVADELFYHNEYHRFLHSSES